MARTIPVLAREALDVQNACNMRGVVRSFALAMTDLDEALSATPGSCSLRDHAITRAWVDKLASLAGTQCICERACDRMSGVWIDLEALAKG